jgi:hypothetical protein
MGAAGGTKKIHAIFHTVILIVKNQGNFFYLTMYFPVDKEENSGYEDFYKILLLRRRRRRKYGQG